MARHSRFYLGRVVKINGMSSELLTTIIQSAPTFPIRGMRYTFTDVRIFGSPEKPNGIFARLTKYRPEGAVAVVRPELHQLATEPVPDLLDASSEFVYLSDFSGIAYRHVWNALPRETFESVFTQLISLSDLAFMKRCEIHPVVDLRTFVVRLSKLSKITSLNATVRPPNPLFGPCWKSLSEYLKKRNLDEMKVAEESAHGIATKIPEIAAVISSPNTSKDEHTELMEPLLDGVGDAALLMASDGYGSARVIGDEDGKVVAFRTSDNQKSFQMPVDIDPEALYQEAHKYFLQISKERYLEH